MKKFLSFILTLVICLSAFSLFSAAAGEEIPTAPVYYGVQSQDAGGNKQNLRFISLVNSLVGSSIGYEISVKYGEKTSEYTYAETATNVVYSSIIAADKSYSASYFGAKEALMTVVIKGVPTNIGVIDFTVTPCVEYDGNIIRGIPKTVRFNGSKFEGIVDDDTSDELEISVMSFNVLNVWTNDTAEKESAEDRSRVTLKMAYDAGLDFVCFQEFDINYRHYIDGDKEIKGQYFWNPSTYTPYAEYYSEIGDFKAKYAELSLTGKTVDAYGEKIVDYQSRIWNPIYYDKTQYEVVDSGVYDFVEWGLNSYESVNYTHSEADNNTSDSRSLVWGVFEHKLTGERVIVTNTHFSPNITGIDGPTVRQAEAEFVVEKVEALYEEYQCATVMCGDYNSSIGGSGCKNILDTKRYYDTWKLATEKTYSNGYHADCKNRHNNSTNSAYESSKAPEGAYSEAIDHILTRTELNVSRYDIITDKTFEGYTYVSSVLDLSDHCPVIMTFRIPLERSEGRLDIVIGDAVDVTVEWIEE